MLAFARFASGGVIFAPSGNDVIFTPYQRSNFYPTNIRIGLYIITDFITI